MTPKEENHRPSSAPTRPQLQFINDYLLDSGLTQKQVHTVVSNAIADGHYAGVPLSGPTSNRYLELVRLLKSEADFLNRKGKFNKEEVK